MLRDSKRGFEEFAEFLRDFIQELNNLSNDGMVVLVEGKRDVDALRGIGYTGNVMSISAFNSKGTRALLEDAKSVTILTDLDREGRRLAARYTRLLRQMGMETSLVARRRWSRASRGTFLHVENLKRFSPLAGQVEY